MPLILASSSPRRAELLSSAGFTFEIVPGNVDETPIAGEPPRAYALRVARAKAECVRSGLGSSVDDRVILAADTVVVAGSRLMGKPLDAADAASMLRALSGVVHEVHTAVVIRGRRGNAEQIVTTRVRFRPMTEEDIAWYVGSGEALGKAGAYGIQGRAARFIDWIEGSWSNVVGLPIADVYRLLVEVGAEPGKGPAKLD